MAVTTFGTNDALTVKLWSKRLDHEVLKETYFKRFIGTSASSLAQEMTETKKGPGDVVKWGLRTLFTGKGRVEGQTLEGNEESLSIYSDSGNLGYLRHAARTKNDKTIDAQRVHYNLRQECFDGLKDWWTDRLDTIFFNQLCGYTVANTDSATGGASHQGGNTILAPTTNRIVRAGAQANDQSLSSSHPMTLNLLDQAVLKAKTASPMLRPVKVGGKQYYVVFIHPAQAYSLRSDTSTAGNWFDLQKARLQGGEGDDNGIFSGAIGIYNNCIIHESTRITKGVHSTGGTAVDNTRRAVFCGAQSLAVFFGQEMGPTKFNWVEEKFDYDEEVGVGSRLIFGMKKSVFNSEDYGVITIPTYSSQ